MVSQYCIFINWALLYAAENLGWQKLDKARWKQALLTVSEEATR